MFIKNENVVLEGDALYDELSKYAFDPQVFAKLESMIRRVLRSMRALADVEKFPLSSVICKASVSSDMLVLEIMPHPNGPMRFLPSEGIRGCIRMHLSSGRITGIHDMTTQLIVIG